jgi:DNA-binding MarR family transcriptional regulator
MPDIGEEPRWLDTGQQSAWRALVLGTTLLFDRLDDDLRRHHNISLAEYEILVRLSERDGQMRMAQLADAMAHSRSRITHTVKRMERSDLVERIDSPDDGRGVVARLTERGSMLLSNVAPTHVEGVREHLVDLASDEDLQAMGRVMDAVADHLIARHPEMELRHQGD